MGQDRIAGSAKEAIEEIVDKAFGDAKPQADDNNDKAERQGIERLWRLEGCAEEVMVTWERPNRMQTVSRRLRTHRRTIKRSDR